MLKSQESMKMQTNLIFYITSIGLEVRNLRILAIIFKKWELGIISGVSKN